ncbi:protein MpTPD1 [Marchantia polymorpha subsp. ruderalis]
MGALICGKVSAKKLSFTVVVTALVFIYTFVYSEFGRILESKRSELVTSTAMSFSTGPFLRLDEIGDLKRRSRQSRRLLISELCTKSDISIFQGEISPLPNGIPTFNVQIMNLCSVGCPISNIHVACGWFASAKLINPEIFKRLAFNDCLVNDGKPLYGGDSISFEYSNSFEYPMRVETADLCKP